MFEESVSSVPSIWATVNSWFTPAILFVFLNLMIATIALTSSLCKHDHHEQENPEQEQDVPRNLQRSPSFLQRLKSINFYSHSYPPTVTHYTDYSHSPAALQEQEQEDSDEKPKSLLARSPSNLLQRLKSFSLYSSNSSPEPAAPSPPTTNTNQFEEQSPLDEMYSQSKGHEVGRTKSDTKPASGEVPTKLAKKMKKSASAKSAFSHFEEDDIVERFRPASAREYEAKVSDDDEEEEEGEVDAKADDFINRFKQQLKLQRLDSILRNRGHG